MDKIYKVALKMDGNYHSLHDIEIRSQSVASVNKHGQAFFKNKSSNTWRVYSDTGHTYELGKSYINNVCPYYVFTDSLDITPYYRKFYEAFSSMRNANTTNDGDIYLSLLEGQGNILGPSPGHIVSAPRDLFELAKDFFWSFVDFDETKSWDKAIHDCNLAFGMDGVRAELIGANVLTNSYACSEFILDEEIYSDKM